jgi:hypothetical protein
METLRVTLLRGVHLGDGRRGEPGETITLPRWLAVMLIGSGKALEAQDPPPEVEVADPSPTTRDPALRAPARRARP